MSFLHLHAPTVMNRIPSSSSHTRVVFSTAVAVDVELTQKLSSSVALLAVEIEQPPGGDTQVPALRRKAPAFLATAAGFHRGARSGALRQDETNAAADRRLPRFPVLLHSSLLFLAILGDLFCRETLALRDWRQSIDRSRTGLRPSA